MAIIKNLEVGKTIITIVNKKVRSIALALAFISCLIFPIASFAQTSTSQVLSALPSIQSSIQSLSQTLNQTATISLDIENSDFNFSSAIINDDIDAIYPNISRYARWENLKPSADFYQSPYRISLFSPQNGEDSARLWSTTKSILAYGFGTLGLLAVLPEEISKWEDGLTIGKFPENIGNGPVWDRDENWLNILGHPYFGGVYYQAARDSGYRQWDAFIYSALLSTFYWEAGIEAIAERPSLQDIVITPVLGWVYGEWAFNHKWRIQQAGGSVLGSNFLGGVALFLLDPADSVNTGINNLFGKEIVKSAKGYVDIKKIPYGENGQEENQISLNLSLQFGDGKDNASNASKRYSYKKDPIDTGIVGISYGAGTTELDDAWGIEGDTTSEITLGLYFSPKFSTRMAYSKGKFDNRADATVINYENYSVDSQFYFNSANDFRPYLTTGFGEIIRGKERETKKFQVNAGVGAHYKLNNNFALQLDWRYFHSTNANTSDANTSLRLLYFFGNGED